MIRKSKSLFTAAATAVLVGVTAGSVVAATTQDQLQAAQNSAAEAENELQQAQSRIEELSSAKSDAETYLTELQTQLTELTEELDELEIQYQDKQYELDQIEIALEEANEDEETQRDAMSKRIQYMYESSTGSGTLSTLFSSDSFMDFIDRASNFSEMTSFDRDMLEEYGDICSEIEEQEAQIVQEEAEIEALREGTEAKKQEITDLYEQTSDEIADLAEELAGEESTAATLLEEVQAQQELVYSLAVQATAEEEAAQQAAAASQTKASSSVDSSASAGSSVSSGGTSSSYANTSTSSSSYSGSGTSSYSGSVLTKSAGVNQGPTGKETYYNLDMSGVVSIMRSMGNSDQYWVRSDGVKMLGNYVMVAADLNTYSRGSIVESSLGQAIVCDTGGFAASNSTQLDIATAW